MSNMKTVVVKGNGDNNLTQEDFRSFKGEAAITAAKSMLSLEIMSSLNFNLWRRSGLEICDTIIKNINLESIAFKDECMPLLRELLYNEFLKLAIEANIDDREKVINDQLNKMYHIINNVTSLLSSSNKEI